ncbi:MAG TPA: muconolactone Delta-isomerase family protein [Candidatus Limnocylindrales bacterium]
MQFLAMEIAVEGVGEAQFTPEIGAAEARRVWDLHQAGTARELYFRADSPAAVLVLECLDIAEAATALASLPMVAAGLIRFEIVPLRPYPGFARLFAPTEPA